MPALIGAAGATLAGVIVAGRQARTGRSNRRLDAYGDVLRFAHRTLRWVQRTRPLVAYSGEVPPEPPTVEEQISARSTMTLFGTKKARTAFTQFMDEVNKFTHVVNEMAITDTRHAAGRFGRDDRDLWAEVHDARQAVEAAFDYMAEVLPRES